jgi:hypothetical protein
MEKSFLSDLVQFWTEHELKHEFLWTKEVLGQGKGDVLGISVKFCW